MSGDHPSFPLDLSGPNSSHYYLGLTKRELFAAMAMQACRSRHSAYKSWQDLASDAVDIADALIAALDSNNGRAA